MQRQDKDTLPSFPIRAMPEFAPSHMCVRDGQGADRDRDRETINPSQVMDQQDELDAVRRDCSTKRKKQTSDRSDGQK